MSASQQASFTKVIIEEAKGDILKISHSYANADMLRRKMLQQLTEDYKNQWNAPKFASLHWDSKLMSSLADKSLLEERLCVVVGTTHSAKLLGTLCYKNTAETSGTKIVFLITDLLQSWHCIDAIVNMTFDTTVSNTGHVSAACVTIQQNLNKALLWSGCRHHVGEVKASKSPDVGFFLRFKKNFKLLNNIHKSYVRNSLSMLDFSVYNDEAKTLLEECCREVMQLAQFQLQLKRDDYKEFIELCCIFLNEATPDEEHTFNKLEALHKAK